MTINTDKILHAAGLAKLHLGKEDMHAFVPRLVAVFNWIEQLQSVNTQGVEPLVNPMEDMAVQNRELRVDRVTDGNCAAEILSGAPSQEFNMFKVPKVVE